MGEARLMVNTSLYACRDKLDELGPTKAISWFAERVADNAALIEALEAAGWQISIDSSESDADELYLYGAKQFSSSDAALSAAATIPGAIGRTLGWRIGEDDPSDPNADEYLSIGAA